MFVENIGTHSNRPINNGDENPFRLEDQRATASCFGLYRSEEGYRQQQPHDQIETTSCFGWFNNNSAGVFGQDAPFGSKQQDEVSSRDDNDHRLNVMAQMVQHWAPFTSIPQKIKAPSESGDSGNEAVSNAVSPSSVIAANDDPNNTFVSKTIAKELLELHPEERNRIYEEIHGVAGTTATDASYLPEEEKDIDTVNDKLNQLDALLKDKHPNTAASTTQGGEVYVDDGFSAYEKAMMINPKYVGGRRLRLMFLRACQYNIQETCDRIVTHFEWKEKLFCHGGRQLTWRSSTGDTMNGCANDISVLGRPLQYSDLEEGDIKAIKGGLFVALPGLDMAGRRIFMINSKYSDTIVKSQAEFSDNDGDDDGLDSHSRTFLRIVMFQNCFHLWNNYNNEQINGIVTMVYTVGSRGLYTRFLKSLIKLPSIKIFLPVRLISQHVCYSSSLMHAMIQLQLRFTYRDSRLRTVHQYGQTHMEVQYKLLGYGINPSILPIDLDGNLRSDVIERCIVQYQQMPILPTGYATTDDELKDAEGGFSPRPNPNVKGTPTSGGDEDSKKLLISNNDVSENDVLFGRQYFKHPGNVQLQRLIEQYSSNHSQGARFDKIYLTWKIVEIVKDEYGGRFLQQQSSGSSSGGDTLYWVEVDDDVARGKVAYGFRTAVKLEKNRKKKTTNVKKTNSKKKMKE